MLTYISVLCDHVTLEFSFRYSRRSTQWPRSSDSLPDMNSSDYLNLPAGKPPPGVTPNFDHPQSRAVEQYVGVGICLGFALIFVLLRLYVKLAIRRWWGWDDCKSFYAVIFFKAHVSRGLSVGICETCRSPSLANCSDWLRHRDWSQPTLVWSFRVSFGFRLLGNSITRFDWQEWS